jgi:hypothetical protein
VLQKTVGELHKWCIRLDDENFMLRVTQADFQQLRSMVDKEAAEIDNEDVATIHQADMIDNEKTVITTMVPSSAMCNDDDETMTTMVRRKNDDDETVTTMVLRKNDDDETVTTMVLRKDDDDDETVTTMVLRKNDDDAVVVLHEALTRPEKESAKNGLDISTVKCIIEIDEKDLRDPTILSMAIEECLRNVYDSVTNPRELSVLVNTNESVRDLLLMWVKTNNALRKYQEYNAKFLAQVMERLIDRDTVTVYVDELRNMVKTQASRISELEEKVKLRTAASDHDEEYTKFLTQSYSPSIDFELDLTNMVPGLGWDLMF